jgi:predicted phage tail protein
LDAGMLAQLYGAGDQLREAAAAQAVNTIIGSGMATGSIAQALSPNDDKDRARDSGSADSAFSLRGRS